jgi:uncharacterized protein (UPF0179 family)
VEEVAGGCLVSQVREEALYSITMEPADVQAGSCTSALEDQCGEETCPSATRSGVEWKVMKSVGPEAWRTLLGV